jgi:hypothetical protein
MYYTRRSVGSVYYPKLLGIYEKELHPVFKGAHPDFEKILVVGASEGYYAVGLARRWKKPVLAFEASSQGRELMTRLALINRVNIYIQGAFKTNHNTRAGKDFILMDV